MWTLQELRRVFSEECFLGSDVCLHCEQRELKLYEFNVIIECKKKKYNEEQLIKYKNETKLLWSTLNEIMNKRARKNSLLPKKFAGNNSEEMITNPHEIADKFNEYFINVGSDSKTRTLRYTRNSTTLV